MRRPGSVNQMPPSDRQTTSFGRLIRLPALIAVHQHRDTAIGRHAGNAPVAAFAHHQPALQVEGRAVALTGLAAHDLRRLPRPQPEQQTASDVDEIVKAVGVPGRAFGEDKPGRQAFRRSRLQDVVECRHRRPSHRMHCRARGYSPPEEVSIPGRQFPCRTG